MDTDSVRERRQTRPFAPSSLVARLEAVRREFRSFTGEHRSRRA